MHTDANKKMPAPDSSPETGNADIGTLTTVGRRIKLAFLALVVISGRLA